MSSTPQPQGRFNRFQYLPVLSNRSIYSATPRHASNASSQGRVVPDDILHEIFKYLLEDFPARSRFTKMPPFDLSIEEDRKFVPTTFEDLTSFCATSLAFLEVGRSHLFRHWVFESASQLRSFQESVIDRDLEDADGAYPLLSSLPWAPSKNLQSITIYVPNISLDDRILFKEFFNALLDWQPPPIRYIKLGFACVETLIEEVKLAQAAEKDPNAISPDLDVQKLKRLGVRTFVIDATDANPFGPGNPSRSFRADDFFHLIHLLEKVQELTIIRCQLRMTERVALPPANRLQGFSAHSCIWGNLVSFALPAALPAVTKWTYDGLGAKNMVMFQPLQQANRVPPSCIPKHQPSCRCQTATMGDRLTELHLLWTRHAWSQQIQLKSGLVQSVLRSCRKVRILTLGGLTEYGKAFGSDKMDLRCLPPHLEELRLLATPLDFLTGRLLDNVFSHRDPEATYPWVKTLRKLVIENDFSSFDHNGDYVKDCEQALNKLGSICDKRMTLVADDATYGSEAWPRV